MTTINIHDDYIEVLKDGYNIIDKTVYDAAIVYRARTLLKMMEQL